MYLIIGQKMCLPALCKFQMCLLALCKFHFPTHYVEHITPKNKGGKKNKKRRMRDACTWTKVLLVWLFWASTSFDASLGDLLIHLSSTALEASFPILPLAFLLGEGKSGNVDSLGDLLKLSCSCISRKPLFSAISGPEVSSRRFVEPADLESKKLSGAKC